MAQQNKYPEQSQERRSFRQEYASLDKTLVAPEVDNAAMADQLLPDQKIENEAPHAESEVVSTNSLQPTASSALSAENHGAVTNSTQVAQSEAVPSSAGSVIEVDQGSRATSVVDQFKGFGGLTDFWGTWVGLGAAVITPVLYSGRGGESQSSNLGDLNVAVGPLTSEHGLIADVYLMDGKTLLASGSIQPSGVSNLSLGNYTGGVVVKIVDAGTGADYVDSVTGEPKDVGFDLGALTVVEQGQVNVNINPLTALAALSINDSEPDGQISDETISKHNQMVANSFGLKDLHSEKVTLVVDEQGQPNPAFTSKEPEQELGSAEKYGAVLAVLSGAASVQQDDMQNVLQTLATQIDSSSNSLKPEGLALVMQGAEVASQGPLGQYVNFQTLMSDLTTKQNDYLSIQHVAVDDVIADDEKNIQISGKVADAEVVRLSFNGLTRNATLSDDQWSYTLTGEERAGLTAGSLIVEASVDIAGESVTALRAVSVAPDVTAPVAPVIEMVAEDDIVNFAEQTAMISGSAEAYTNVELQIAATTHQIEVDGEGRWRYSLTAADLEAMGQGEATLIATGVDNSGNRSSETLHAIRIDTVAPTANLGSVTDDSGRVTGALNSGDSSDDSSLLLAGSSENGSTVNIYNGTQLLGEALSEEGGWNFAVSIVDGSRYQLNVTEQDAAGNLSLTTADFVVMGDMSAPEISSRENATAIDENSGAGQRVYTAVARDVGGVAADSIGYSLKAVNDHSHFTIDSSSGDVTLNDNPDYKTQAGYSFTVVATDVAGNASEQQVLLAINPLNDVAPSITSGETATALDENSGAQQLIYTVTSTDAGGVGSVTRYRLKVVDDYAGLTIDSTSGEVRLNDNPDYESKASYRFTVMATDEDENTGEQNVSLDINNLDEVAPTITSGTSASLDENAGENPLVYTATSTDVDDITAGITSYSLKEVADYASFMIDAGSGEISLNGNPDYETTSDYNFTVVATDAAANSSEQAVSLSINNIDEVAPSITSGAVAALDENSGVNRLVYTATSTDSEDVATGSTRYSLQAADDYAAFTIDSVSGEISLNDDPDYETTASYSFTVVATDAAANASEQLVSLSINNLDEVAPEMTSGAVAASLDENSGVNQLVYTAISTDSGDIATGSTRYSLKAVDDYARFIIDSVSGEVLLTDNPDYDTQASYNFTVLAMDAAGNVSEQPVSLNVRPPDETAPTITSATTATRLDENSGGSQLVYTVSATDAAEGAISYSLKAVNDYARFTINSTSGEVQLWDNPDYESKASYRFTVEATDEAGNRSEKAVMLGINNLDEIVPTITSGATATSLDENSGADQLIYTITSTDTADIVTGATGYRLKAVDDYASFTLDAGSGEITLNDDPDYETKSSYGFTVVATDGAGNVSEQAVTLVINNLDTPIITSGASATSLDENSGANQQVYTTTITYLDDGVTGNTRYSLKTVDDYASFSIDVTSGEVTLNDNPDYEDNESYRFTVVATSASGNSSEQAVTLAITNLDDAPPDITSGAIATGLDENSGADQLVYTITSTDNGDMVTGSTAYRLKTVADYARFSVDSVSGEVRLLDDPDYDTKASYSFIVVATDAAGNASEKLVTLAINNQDETAPIITSATTANSVIENSGANQQVYTVTSTDPDVVSGSTRYSLKAEADYASFTIDGDSGEVTLSDDPDYDTQASYNFTVVATDGAGNRREQAVTLDITDQDEVAPTITSGTTATSLDENSGADQRVYTVTSTDSEDISAGSTRYSLQESDDYINFTIDSDSGEVTLNENPDYDAKASYDFTVVATDAAGNSSQQAVTLVINNIDETPPSITSSASADALDESTGANQIVYTVTSSDPDVATGSTRYSLKEIDDYVNFTIDSASGEVRLTANPDYETITGYAFTVVATDAAGNSNEQSVSLAINNVDEVAPVITSGADASHVTDNAGVDQMVYTATSIDSIDFLGGTTSYRLKAVDDFSSFSIDATSGEVTLNDNPDYETKASYNFTVVATDTAGNSSEQSVAVAVDNVDEVAPTITSGATATALDENSGASQLVYTVTSTDTGDTVSGNTRYSLKAVDDAASFSIDDLSGGVRLIDNPNYETQASYSFTVIATDAAGNSSEQVVTQQITNLDEVAPTFTSGASINLDENSGVNQLVYTAITTDSADIASGNTSYSLKSVDDYASFTIDASSGAVTLDVNPDHEIYPEYSFTVLAIDAAGNESEQAVVLTINDLDEAAPSIASGATATGLNENSGANQLVYTATSTDTDDIAIGNTRYSLKAVDDFASFTIDGASGEIRLIDNPDYESQQSYSFTVVATDTAGYTDEQLVSLAIANLDEVAPTFTSGTTILALNENSGANQSVYTATSTDNGDTNAGSTRYSLKAVDDAASFSVDSSTGVVSLVANPNYEAKSSYNFTVLATDAAGNASEQALSFTINNLDEVAPSITSGATATSLADGSGNNQLVYTATSTDVADTATGNTSYSLKAGGDSASFTIDSATGAIRLSDNPDYAAKASYDFTVVAGDVAGNSSEQAVSLAISSPSVVVFDLLEGVSSSHSSRTFDSGVDYTIYLRVNSSDQALSSDGSSGNASASWAAWSGANNLDAGDKLILVGNGTAVLGGTLKNPVDHVDTSAVQLTWATSQAQSAAKLTRSGILQRNYSGNTATLDIWSGQFNLAALASVTYQATIPANMLTTQGLA